MLNITITVERDATECDYCDSEYREENGCCAGKTSTEVMACRVEAQQLAAEGHETVYAEDVM